MPYVKVWKHSFSVSFRKKAMYDVQQFMTRFHCLLIGGSLNPGRTIGWFGGAGPLGGGGALILEREVEPGGTLGAGLDGEAPSGRDLISGFRALCRWITLLL
jgi:hypothetical protein